MTQELKELIEQLKKLEALKNKIQIDYDKYKKEVQRVIKKETTTLI